MGSQDDHALHIHADRRDMCIGAPLPSPGASTAPSVVPSSGDEASGASLRGGSDMHALELDVTLPYTSTQFDTTKKTAYKAAIKSAGGAKVDHVDIEKVTEIHDHRRQHDDDKVTTNTV